MSSQPIKRRYHEAPGDELLSRTRRIETRLTQLMIGLGIETQAQRPLFSEDSSGHGRLIVPSRHSPLKEILDSIPDDWHGPVRVFVGADPVLTIRKPQD